MPQYGFIVAHPAGIVNCTAGQGAVTPAHEQLLHSLPYYGKITVSIRLPCLVAPGFAGQLFPAKMFPRPDPSGLEPELRGNSCRGGPFSAHSVSCVPFLPYFDFFLALIPEICYTVFATQMNISHRKCLW